MKILTIILMLLLVGCSSCQANLPAGPTPVLTINVVRVKGDTVPEIAQRLPEIALGGQTVADAVFISNSLLYQAVEDGTIRQQLQQIALERVLLIHRATTKDVSDILQLGTPSAQTTASEYVLVAVRVTPAKAIVHGVLVPPMGDVEDLASTIEETVKQVQLLE